MSLGSAEIQKILRTAQDDNSCSLVGALEEFEETDVVLAEEAKVLYLVLEIGAALDTHTECVARVYLAVDPAKFEHVGVNHTATQNLYPACVLAEWATLAATDVATDVHLGTWFSEWEV